MVSGARCDFCRAQVGDQSGLAAVEDGFRLVRVWFKGTESWFEGPARNKVWCASKQAARLLQTEPAPGTRQENSERARVRPFQHSRPVIEQLRWSIGQSQDRPVV